MLNKHIDLFLYFCVMTRPRPNGVPGIIMYFQWQCSICKRAHHVHAGSCDTRVQAPGKIYNILCTLIDLSTPPWARCGLKHVPLTLYTNSTQHTAACKVHLSLQYHKFIIRHAYTASLSFLLSIFLASCCPSSTRVSSFTLD